MSMLLNRKYGSRLECLYYILKSCYERYGTNSKFAMKNLKFDEKYDKNVHKYCKQLTESVGVTHCPYLVNPLNPSKCYATQSLISDSTKSKAVSDVKGSLEALGFIKRINKTSYMVSKEGEMWVNSDYNSLKWENIALNGVLSYGVIIGFLSKIRNLPNEFTYSGIYLGYPKTEEKVEYIDNFGNKKIINLSTDSKKDSNTRTMSRVIAWCVATGILEPIMDDISTSTDIPHIKYRSFLNKGELTTRCFRKTKMYSQIFSEKRYVENPLSYARLHKDVESLRENGEEDLRKITLQYYNNILNRRFVFVYVLNYYSKKGEMVSFSKLIEEMIKFNNYFFSSGNDAYDIMKTEAKIADITGIPFDIIENDMISPLTIINDNVLTEDANDDIVKIAEKIIKSLEGNQNVNSKI